MSFALEVIRDLEEVAKRLGFSGKSKMRDFSGLKSVPGVDIQKAFKIISQLESGGGYAIGDSGTSFGATQVQLGSFLNNLSKDPQTVEITGMDSESLRKLSKEWARSKKKMRSVDIWTPVVVDENDVRRFMHNNPKKVVRRREGTTVRYKPEEFTVAKVDGNTIRGYRLDLDSLRDVGLNVDSPTIRRQLVRIVGQYITDTVARNAISKLLTSQADPKTYAKFQSMFSRRNVKENQKLRDLADRASQRDFMNKVNSVINDVQETGYDTNAPGAYNIYQLIGIANASGAGRVRRFLRYKKPFGSAHLHYLQRANPLISKVTGFSSNFPSGGGLGGFRTAVASLNLSKRATFILKFPSEYAEDVRSGKREMTIREGDIPAQVDQVVRCETYAGGLICHVLITSKEMMSVTRIRKAFGKKVANELERNFGPDSRFMVIRFAVHENNNDDNYDNNSFGKKDRTNTPLYDGGTLEHVPFGRQMFPVEPGHYHASSEFLLSKKSQKERLNLIWKLAEETDWEELLRQEGLGEESEEEEVEEFSEQWIERERQKMQELARVRKEQFNQPEKEPEPEAEPEPEVEPDVSVEPKSEPSVDLRPKKVKDKPRSFKEKMKGVEIPTLEDEENGDEDEDFSLASLIEEIETKEDIDEILDEFVGEEESDKLLDKRKGDENRLTKVMLQNKNTIFGFKLDLPEGGWEKMPQPPAMTKQAQDTFSLNNLKNYSAMNQLFSKPTTWAVLQEQPNTQEILQKWILPALVYNVGRRWFDIYSKRNQIGPITLFDREDIEEAKIRGVSLDQTAQGKKYLSYVTTYVTDAANSYFSAEKNNNVPIADYVGAVVRNAMTREVGYARGFRAHEMPVCTICKQEQTFGAEVGILTKNKSLPYKVQTLKKGIYTCARCKEKADRLIGTDIKQAKAKVKENESELFSIQKLVEEKSAQLEALEKAEPRDEEKIKALAKELGPMKIKLTSQERAVDDWKGVLEHHESQLKKYQGQINVPLQHVWCPKQDCPGQRVPLTAIDWSDKEYWTSDTSKPARDYLSKKYLIVSPYEKGVKQEADGPMFDESQVREIVLSEGDVSAKLEKLVGKERDFDKVEDLWKNHKSILSLDKNLVARLKKLNKLHEILQKNPKYKGILEENPNLREVIEHGPTQLSHIPPKVLFDVPFICPHDNVKFTIRQAMDWAHKDIHKHDKDKEWSARGGLFYKPHMKRYWYKDEERELGMGEGDLDRLSYKAEREINESDESLTYQKLSELARQIFLKKYWDKIESLERYKKANPFLAAKPEKLAANPKYKEQLAMLKLYDSVRQFSTNSPEEYVGWLSSREFRPTKEQKQTGVEKITTNKGSSKDKEEKIYGPIIQRWFDSMTQETDGFVKHGLSSWVVNSKDDGIPSYPTAKEAKNKSDIGKDGTYFLAKIDAMGFKMNLVSRKRKRDGFGSQPRMIRIVGAWEIPKDELNLDVSKVSGQVALTPAEANSLKSEKENRVRGIESHTYREAKFDKDEGNFRPGNFMLVQAYLMPSVRNWTPFRYVYKLREDADDERIFAEFGQVALLHESNPSFWRKFHEDLKKYKGSPEQIHRMIRSKLSKEKVSWLSPRGKFLLSIRDY